MSSCPVRVILAKKYDLVVGDTFQLYYKGVVEAPNPYCYSIVAVCEKGKNMPRYFEFTPETAGEHKLTISVYDAQQNLLGSAQTVLNVVEPSDPKKKTNILVVGDSLTASGTWVAEVNRRISASDGKPKGLGYEGINFVGGCSQEGVRFEAFGGWSWYTFTKVSEGAMWVECPNDRTEQDQHSLWKDENGAIWQIETLQIDYLKFNRYKDHTSPRPTGGYLYHYKNAVNQQPIKIHSSSTERTSPFYNTQAKKIDFKWYAKNNGIDSIDAFYILLGGNGTMRQIALNNTRHDYCKIVVEEAKVLVDKMHEDFPNAKIKVMAMQLPSQNGGMGWSYGAEMPFTNHYNFTHYVMELNLAYEKWCEEEGYKDYMEFISLTGQFDSENNYPSIQKPVNVRSEITERVDTNGLHPSKSGYMQVADAVFRNVVKEFCSKK